MFQVTDQTTAEEVITFLVQAAAVVDDESVADEISEQIDLLMADLKYLERCFELDYVQPNR